MPQDTRMGMAEYQVLDLFAGLGGFSSAFEDSERWDVTTVEIEERFDPDICADVFDLRPSDFDTEFDVVLASPPCTEFSTAQNMNGSHEPDGDHIALVHHTIGLIEGLRPSYWYLENPRSRLRSYIGKPEGSVTYCQYGENHMKPTDLWGKHAPMTYRSCHYGDGCHVNHTTGTNAMRKLGKNDASKRSVVPYELSDSIRESCESALDGEAHEQSELLSF